jgi:mitogen-activated protein kinase 1/3
LLGSGSYGQVAQAI